MMSTFGLDAPCDGVWAMLLTLQRPDARLYRMNWPSPAQPTLRHGSRTPRSWPPHTRSPKRLTAPKGGPVTGIFLEHVLAGATLLRRSGADQELVAVGLLHDAVERG